MFDSMAQDTAPCSDVIQILKFTATKSAYLSPFAAAETDLEQQVAIEPPSNDQNAEQLEAELKSAPAALVAVLQSRWYKGDCAL